MFLPTTREEMHAFGWKQLDVILVSGDTYIDSPFIGVAVIGNILASAGYRVGIIAQPDTHTDTDIGRLGEPLLFWGVSGGSVDSMVANYTASGKKRKSDDFTPGGINDRRPDRAVIAYCNLIRRYFKNSVPLVLGGIEASLRRIAHYDFWSNSIRRSVLLDAKADYLLYGMADRTVLQFAAALKSGTPPTDVRGLCYMAADPERKADDCPLPGWEDVKEGTAAFSEMFAAFYHNSDPTTARRLLQKYGPRTLVHNPPAEPLAEREVDAAYNLAYEREVHPYYARAGKVPALETIRFSITTHRGCYGECNFCAIAVHQGRTIQSRSLSSILTEAEAMTGHPAFKGVISDVGGATANMYGIECEKKISRGACREKRCLFPEPCRKLPINHTRQRQLLAALKKLPGVRHVFVASGVRYDMVLQDKRQGEGYLADLIASHISGQMKVAPEHSEPEVLALMGKPDSAQLVRFRALFERLAEKVGKRLFLTYYFIAAHPGCRLGDMRKCQQFVRRELRISPEQVQIFTPTPSTWSTLMYCTGNEPETGMTLFVEKDRAAKERQKGVLTATTGDPEKKARHFPRQKHNREKGKSGSQRMEKRGGKM